MCEDGGCCRSFCKILLIIVNIIFFLAGLLMLAFGIAVTAAPRKVVSILASFGDNAFDDIKDASDGYFADVVQAVGIFMIVLGGIVAIVACFGFFGACCESKCMLVTYIVLMIIIVLAEVALIIFGAVFPDKFEQTGKDAFYKFLTTKFDSDFQVNSNGTLENKSGASRIWSTVQLELECCGVYGPDDYSPSKNWNWTKCNDCVSGGASSQIKIPISCCKLKNTDKIPTQPNDFINANTCMTAVDATSTNTQSCGKAAKETIMKYGKIAIGIAAGIVGLQLILIALAIIMCCMWEGRTGKYV